MTPADRLDGSPAPRTASARPAPPADLWRRFRAPLVAAPLSGAVAGALTAGVLQLVGFGSAPDISSAGAMALLLAAIGALLAGVGALGAVAAVLLGRRHLRSPGVTGYGTVALGAGLAVGVVILLIGAVIGGGGFWTTAVVVAAVGAALLSAAAAAVITALALRWVHRP